MHTEPTTPTLAQAHRALASGNLGLLVTAYNRLVRCNQTNQVEDAMFQLNAAIEGQF